MPKCIECGKSVISGFVLDGDCLEHIRAAACGKEYTCLACGNTEHPADANFCKICGTAIILEKRGICDEQRY